MKYVQGFLGGVLVAVVVFLLVLETPNMCTMCEEKPSTGMCYDCRTKENLCRGYFCDLGWSMDTSGRLVSN